MPSARRAFKLAIVEYLSANAGMDAGAIAIGAAPGRPRPECGEWFICVWGGSRSFGIKTALDVTQSVNLTLTKRFTGPIDRWDQALDAEDDGFDERMGALVSLLMAGQNDIRKRTAELMADGVDGTSEAPYPMNDPEPQPVGAEWFEAEAGPGKGGGQIYGLQSTLVYGGLRITHPWDQAVL